MGRPVSQRILPANRILVVEDDRFFRYLICETLRDLGYEVVECSTAQEAILAAQQENPAVFLVDAMLPNYPDDSGIEDLEARGGFQTGVALLRRLREGFKQIPAILMTGHPNSEIQRWCQESDVVYMVKPIERNTMREVLEQLTGKKSKKRSPVTFIVHGQDQSAVDELRNLIKGKLRFTEPLVLRKQPGRGRTIIESLESFRHVVDVVFVLLTPDDKFCDNKDDDNVKRCARQNVIFELGLFYGYLGRISGRVILLHRGPIDLPSDIQGIKWVDISEGVTLAEKAIRRELFEWL